MFLFSPIRTSVSPPASCWVVHFSPKILPNCDYFGNHGLMATGIILSEIRLAILFLSSYGDLGKHISAVGCSLPKSDITGNSCKYKPEGNSAAWVTPCLCALDRCCLHPLLIPGRSTCSHWKSGPMVLALTGNRMFFLKSAGVYIFR